MAEGEQKFMLILFIDDSERNIDFVPSDWIFYDEKKQHVVTPFIPNASKANIKLLTALVKSESEPPDTWPTHRVSIRGYAKSYAEAEKKIKDLETMSYVYSTEDESHAKAKERAVTKTYKLKGKICDTKAVDDLFAAAAIDLNNENVNENNKSNLKKKHSTQKNQEPRLLKESSKSMKKQSPILENDSSNSSISFEKNEMSDGSGTVETAVNCSSMKGNRNIENQKTRPSKETRKAAGHSQVDDNSNYERSDDYSDDYQSDENRNRNNSTTKQQNVNNGGKSRDNGGEPHSKTLNNDNFNVDITGKNDRKMAPTQKRKLSREEILEKKRDAERARYQKIKDDPARLAQQQEKERLKYLKKKEKGSRKSVSEITPRQQRATRKKWRAHSAVYYAKKIQTNKTNAFLRETTPPSSGDDMEVDRVPMAPAENNPRSRASVTARKQADKQRKKRKEMKKKDATIVKLKTKLECYRKRISRLKKAKVFTPRTKLQKMAEDPGTRKEVVKKALFGQVIEEQIKENYSNARSYREKKNIDKTLLGENVKKHKLWRISSAISYKRLWSARKQEKVKAARRKSVNFAKSSVVTFFENDDNSRLCAGKREYISKNKTKKQKRYLEDTMKNLHKKFLNSTDIIISYALFCRLRPFWVVPPKVMDRDTCLCVTHSNIQLLLNALRNAKILPFTNYQDLLQKLCCDRYNEKCLERSCKTCCKKTLPYQEFVNTTKISYKQWASSKESIVDPKTKKIRYVQKQKQQNFEILPRDLILKLENDQVKFFKHELNIAHQYQTVKILKENLTERDAVIHMDFSENYATKYHQEIHAFHFGGSRAQITLHTVVVYLQNSVTCYCTVSSNLSHNPPAVWAHLTPILRALPSSIDNIHFLSDGPVTQYRNKTMFYVLGCKMSEFYPKIIHFSWNYHEAGHGKGAPDGVGAVCKRTADQVVAHGGDVTNLENFVGVIREKCPGITVFIVSDREIEDMNEMIMKNQADFVSFTGTLMVHQITGSMYLPRQLLMKSLSCFCQPGCCEHFKLGSIVYRPSAAELNVDDVYRDSESGEESREELASPSVSIPIEAEPKSIYVNGDHVLVKFSPKKKEYRYVAVCTEVFQEDDEIKATFLKVCNKEHTLFKVNEKDVGVVAFDQVIEKLPMPLLQVTGNRVFYKFEHSINVSEK